jgi:hypothetical protein
MFRLSSIGVRTLVLGLLAANTASAQESLRNSLAGDTAAEAQRQQAALQQYTYKAGDFKLLAVPSIELDYNDNVNLQKAGQQSDFILKPLLQLSGSYPVTPANILSFSAGVGYDEYLEHGNYSAYRVDSDSLLSFDVYIKDVRIDFHDRFSFFQDPAVDAALAGVAQYGRLMNSAGFSATWDLEDINLTLGYDHQNVIASPAEFSYLDQSSELPLARAGIRLYPQLTVGLEGSASFTSYDQSVLNDNQSYSAGLYGDWQPGAYLHVQPRAGYAIYEFQHTSLSLPPLTPFLGPAPTAHETVQTQNLKTWYADLSVTHQASAVISYGFSAGHEIRLGVDSDAIEDSYFRPNIAWTLVKNLGLNTSLFYEHGSEGAGNISGNFTEVYDWYGGALTLSYALMKKLRLSLNYRLTLRSSSIPTRDYSQNLVGLQLTYQPQ